MWLCMVGRGRRRDRGRRAGQEGQRQEEAQVPAARGTEPDRSGLSTRPRGLTLVVWLWCSCRGSASSWTRRTTSSPAARPRPTPCSPSPRSTSGASPARRSRSGHDTGSRRTLAGISADAMTVLLLLCHRTVWASSTRSSASCAWTRTPTTSAGKRGQATTHHCVRI